MAKRELDFFDNDLPNCAYCIHAFKNDKGITNGRCKAFPEGIPLGILSDRIKHDKVLPQQIGTYIFVEVE